jgi:hypothetical protein
VSITGVQRLRQLLPQCTIVDAAGKLYDPAAIVPTDEGRKGSLAIWGDLFP